MGSERLILMKRIRMLSKWEVLGIELRSIILVTLTCTYLLSSNIAFVWCYSALIIPPD